MNGQSREKRQENSRAERTLPPEGLGPPETHKEPQMRRWRHPVPVEEEPVWQYLCQAVGYQNQLLSEIKVLLEKLILK